MRRSLFESHTFSQTPSPRIRPNIFARVAQFSYRNSISVIVAWVVICAGVLAAGLLSHTRPQQLPLTFATSSPAKENLTTLAKNFPNLNALIALSITNADSIKLQLDRDNVLAKLSEDHTDFELVFSPGAGAYYDTHAILYHSLDDVKARVAYAQSLRPLFAAIAAAPTTESLTTLVNEVSASIELGRDPQGLDELFSESAKTVQALMQGNERQVDWRRVAGLNIEPQPTSALIFVLPKPDSGAKAVSEISKLIAATPTADGTTIVVDQPPLQTPTLADLGSNQLIPGFIMMGIFLLFACLILFADLTLGAMIVVPALCTESLLLGAIALLFPGKMNALWLLAVALAVAIIQLSARHTLAILAVLRSHRSGESAIMLAAQKQGSGIAWMAFGSIAIWLAGLFLFDRDFVSISSVMVFVLLIGLFIVLSIIPAIARVVSNPPKWRAEEWLVPLFDSVFGNRLWYLIRNVLALVSIVVALYGLWLSPQLLATGNQQFDDGTVNIVVNSTDQAEAIIAKLKSVPQAQGVRWIGAFLPQQVDEKLEELKKLKDNFQSITPLIPSATDNLREQIGTLNESLLSIANSPATRPELRKAAQEFRQSVELLTSTSSDKEVRAFENRIFGSFNVLAEEATGLATLDKPNLTTLDPQLRALFLSPSNVYRIEVTPIQGISNAELARSLAALQLPVAHASLVVVETEIKQRHNFLIVLGVIAGVMTIILLFATREAAGFFATLSIAVLGLGTISAIALVLKVQPSPETLVTVMIIFMFNLSLLASAFLKRSSRSGDAPDALYAIEAWLPAVFLAALLTPCLLLDLQPFATYFTWLVAAVAGLTIVAALLLRPLTMLLRGS